MGNHHRRARPDRLFHRFFSCFQRLQYPGHFYRNHRDRRSGPGERGKGTGETGVSKTFCPCQFVNCKELLHGNFVELPKNLTLEKIFSLYLSLS